MHFCVKNDSNYDVWHVRVVKYLCDSDFGSVQKGLPKGFIVYVCPW